MLITNSPECDDMIFIHCQNVNITSMCHTVKLTRPNVERRGRATRGLSSSGKKAEEVLNVGGERLPPWAIWVIQKDGVNYEGQQPLTAVHPHLDRQGKKLGLDLERIDFLKGPGRCKLRIGTVRKTTIQIVIFQNLGIKRWEILILFKWWYCGLRLCGPKMILCA